MSVGLGVQEKPPVFVDVRKIVAVLGVLSRV
jgi:hypothetical protein